MSTLEVANEWLRHSPVKADRFVPMLRRRLAERDKRGMSRQRVKRPKKS